MLIHFEGWNQRYDEWVDMSSERLRPLTRHSVRQTDRRKRGKSVSVVVVFISLLVLVIWLCGQTVFGLWQGLIVHRALTMTSLVFVCVCIFLVSLMVYNLLCLESRKVY